MEFGDLTTLITIGIAVFIFIRLRSVLGSRTGHQNPPNKPNSRRQSPNEQNQASNDNVVTLPNRGKSKDKEEESEFYSDIDSVAKSGSRLNRELRELKDADSAFTPDRFLQGSKMAYEMIVTAFADGDKKTLKNLLSREVFEGFSSAIKQRQDDEHVVQSSFVGVDDAKITAAEINKRTGSITVRFVSQIISATYDKDDNLIDGDAEQITEVIDLWTFSRDMRSRDPNWKLVATEAES
jgi:predicted lipid-binding transport protein (Tim44 family)